MVDREKRDAAAAILEGYRSKRLSNAAFEDFPKSPDRALRAVEKTVWFMYDDLTEHYCDGPHALNAYSASIVDRCILFLHSDVAYEWPTPFLYNGCLEHWGDASVWPFFRIDDYDRAARPGA